MASTGWPAMTMAEIRRGYEDSRAERHWPGKCWCGGHPTGTPETAPPWAKEETGAGQ